MPIQSIPEHIQRLISAFSRLPGIGPKTASRLTFFLLRNSEDLTQELSEALAILKDSTGYCTQCFNLTHTQFERCEICRNAERGTDLICVVEDPLDVLAIERTEDFTGQYHVLHGALSPIEGIGPDDIKIRELLERVDREDIEEVILATNPTLDGDNTAMYLRKLLEPLGVRITRLARGLPVGGDLEYADQNTLRRALSGRSEM